MELALDDREGLAKTCPSAVISGATHDTWRKKFDIMARSLLSEWHTVIARRDFPFYASSTCHAFLCPVLNAIGVKLPRH